MRTYCDNKVGGRRSLIGKYTLATYEVLDAKITDGTHGGRRTLKLLVGAKQEGVPSRAHVDLFGEAGKSFVEDVDVSDIETIIGRELSGVIEKDKNKVVGVALKI